MDSETLETEETSITWRAVGAAVQGASHRKQDLPCQDALEYRVLPSGKLMAALADGAGSAPRSELGARRAVRTALDVLAAAPPEGWEEDPGGEELMRGAFQAAQQALEELAQEGGLPVRDFAATLTCAVAGEDRLVVGHLGDGAVVAENGDGSLFAATRAQRGEYANETYFLTQAEALDQLEVQVFPGQICKLALMSDGLTRLALKMPSGEPHLPFFQPLFAFARSSTAVSEAADQLAAFLCSERVSARTDDDTSLLLAVRLDGRGMVE